MTDSAEIEKLAVEWDWPVNVVAFALGYYDGNVADAKSYLATLADEMDRAVGCE